MGTSANLLIKSSGKQWVQHTSYDGSPSNVFAQVGATVAAGGVDALRSAIARAVIVEDDGDMEQARDISMQVAAEGYLLACQKRGCEPVALMSTLMDPYRLHDFAHGGVITLFGNPLVNQAVFCGNDPDFVLDLDTGTLSALIYESSQDSAPVPGWVLPLDRLDGLSPSRVMETLSSLSLDGSLPASDRQGELDQALDSLLAPCEENPDAPMTDRGVDWPSPSSAAACHQFIAHANNAVSLRMLIGILQRCADRAPVLDQPGVLLAQMTPNDNQEVSLFIDLRKHPDAGLDNLFEKLGDCAELAGMLYRCSGAGVFRSSGGGMMMASVSCGADFPDDDELFPRMGGSKVEPSIDAVPVRTQQARLDDIAADAASMTPEAIGYLAVEKMMARANFDAQILEAIPASVTLSPDQRRTSNIMINLVGAWEDAVLPGARRDRFLALPVPVQEEILQSFKPVGRFMITQSLDLLATTNPTRRPSP